MKKYLTIFIIILIAFCLPLITINADSGWDSSYDSGSSFDSGSFDFGGFDSGWDSSDWGDGTGGIPINDDTFFVILFIMIIIFILVPSEIRKVSSKKILNYQDISPDLINELDPTLDIKTLKQKAFNTYKNVQTAWMNFDNKKLKTLTTDELYNMYSSQLETLKLKNQKNIMDNITLNDVKITSMYEKNNVITVVAYLRVTTYDYVINEKTNKVVRGAKNRKLCIDYLITLIKNKEIIDKCPNCGAEINQENLKVCEYCRSKLVTNKNDYVLSKKTCIGQRKI